MRALRASALTALLLATALVARADGSRYETTGDTVVDTVANQRWQFIPSNAQTMRWDEALTYCDQLTLRDFDDWRLPTVKELMGLVRDDGSIDPAHGMPADPGNGFWSSTHSRQTSEPWIVQGERMLRANVGQIAYVRCMRP